MANKISIFFLAALLSVGIISCQKEDTNIYDVNQLNLSPYGGSIVGGKGKVKTPEQYVSVLYSNFFKRGISVADLNEARDAIYSVGDQELAYEIIVVNYMLRPDAELPSDEFLYQYPDSFLNQVFTTYLVRDISEVERVYLKKYINDNKPEVGAKEVLAAIALCNEFRIY